MRTRSLLAVGAAAVLLGGATGAALHRHPADGGRAADPASTRSAARTGISTRLLDTSDLSRIGAPGPLQESAGAGEGAVARTLCPEWRSLADRLPVGVPMAHATWTSDGDPAVAEIVARLGDHQQSARIGENILDAIESCRDDPKAALSEAGTSVRQPSATATYFWMTLRDGPAFGPHPGPGCGGVAMAVAGPRLALLGVPWCTDDAHMKQIARTAVRRLG